MPTAKRPTSTGGRLPAAGRPRPLSGGAPMSKAPTRKAPYSSPPGSQIRLPGAPVGRVRPGTPISKPMPGRRVGLPTPVTGRMPVRPPGYFGGGAAGMAKRQSYQNARSGKPTRRAPGNLATPRQTLRPAPRRAR